MVCLFTEQFYLLKNVKYQPELRTVLKVDLVPAGLVELLLQSTEQTSQFVPLKGPTRVLFCNSIERNATNLSKWFKLIKIDQMDQNVSKWIITDQNGS